MIRQGFGEEEAGMRVAGRLTEADLKEVREMARSKWYWPRFVLANGYGVALMSVLIWATVAGLTGASKPNWHAIGIIWAVIAAIVAWSVYRTKARRWGRGSVWIDPSPEQCRALGIH